MSHTQASSLDHGSGGWLRALRFSLLSVVILGLGFPLFATFAGQTLFPAQAGGSLIERDGVIVGSSLVAQPFTSDRYFQPRPSAANYDPKALAGSNWAPSNPALRERIATTSTAISQRDSVAAKDIPTDLVTASGSGIDPHISPAAAKLQIARVAKLRTLDPARVQALVDSQTQAPTFGVLGQSRVNVLQLNLALDALVP